MNFVTIAGVQARIRDAFPHLKIRNTPPSTKGSLRGELHRLNRIGVPRLEEPDAFLPRMLQIESELGTCVATLTGLLGSSRIDGLKDVKRGVELFLDLGDEIQKQMHDGFNVRRLFDHLAPHLIFTTPNIVELEKGLDFRVGLEALAENLNGGGKEVGNCNVIGASFCLFPLFFGEMAGEGRKIYEPHSFSQIDQEKEIYFYDVWDIGPISRIEIDIKFKDKPWQKYFLGNDFGGYRFRTNVPMQEIECAEGFSPFQIQELQGQMKKAIAAHNLETFDPKRSRILRTSSFTFIASILALRITQFFGMHPDFEQADLANGPRFGSEREVRAYISNMLAVAQAINPLSFYLYRHQGKMLGGKAQEHFVSIQTYLEKLPMDLDGLPILA